MKNVIGTPARGESFFPRKREVARIIKKLKDGNNLNIAAPRRIGKTSILLYLLDNGEGDFVYVYIDTEDIDNESDFFKRILKEVLRTEDVRGSRRLKHLVESGHKMLSKIKGVKVMGQGIDFSEDDKSTDYKEDLINLLSGIELDNGKKIVILIDEFPQTVQNILDVDPSNDKPARKFLQANREIRLNPAINEKVRFILTGSIGLNHTVAQMGASAFINDLNSVEVNPLNKEEAGQFLLGLLLPGNYSLAADTTDYLLNKIEWLIPFHIQLAVQEILAQATPARQIDTSLIDRAFDAIIQARNENHFNHYYSRLKKQFKEKDLLFAVELLDFLANKGTLKRADIFDLSAKYDLEERWKFITEVLIYDGYINCSEDRMVYRFNSAIVRMWWQKFICK